MNRILVTFVIGVLIIIMFAPKTVMAQTRVDATMSGAWYDPTHNGEGFLLELLEPDEAIIYWFTYDETGKIMQDKIERRNIRSAL